MAEDYHLTVKKDTNLTWRKTSTFLQNVSLA